MQNLYMHIHTWEWDIYNEENVYKSTSSNSFRFGVSLSHGFNRSLAFALVKFRCECFRVVKEQQEFERVG